jgi:ketosteroid isomerase-like protein
MKGTRTVLFGLLALAATAPVLAQAGPEANKALAQRYFDILSAGSLASLDQVIAADFTDRTPGAGSTRGPESIRETQGRARQLFEGIRYTVEDLLADGDRVAARYTVRAQRKGGKSVEVTGVTVFRMANGKIQEAWIFNDQIELFRQLGYTLLPPPPESQKPAPQPSTPDRPAH